MTKCEFCDEEVFGQFRCEKCNNIWNAGVKFGEDSIKSRLKWMRNDFMRLIE